MNLKTFQEVFHCEKKCHFPIIFSKTQLYQRVQQIKIEESMMITIIIKKLEK